MILLYLALAYMTGLGLGQLLWDYGVMSCDFSGWLWSLPLVALPLTALLKRQQPVDIPMVWPASAGFEPPVQRRHPGLWVALALVLMAGIFRYGSQPARPCMSPEELFTYNAPAAAAFDRSVPPVTIVGYVANYPLIQDTSQELYVQVQQLKTGELERVVTGKVRLKTSSTRQYVYGQPVKVRGRLVDPPVFDGFDYRAYLARKGIRSLLYSPRIQVLDGPNQGSPILKVLYAVRRRAETLLNRLLPEPYAALANGMLLGIEAGIPDELYEQFNLTGTSHVIVISGSNVALIAGVLMAFGVRLFGRRRALLPTLAGIGLYAMLVGGDAAVLRAALMGGLFVVAAAINRQSTALVSLAAACWAMTIVNPLTLWDVGFQLSSAATAGLILFTPRLTQFWTSLWPSKTGGRGPSQGLLGKGKTLIQDILQEGLLVTVAANLTTLPLVVYYFGRLSLVSLLTNLLIAPVQPLIMLWGGAGVVVGLLGITPVAQFLLWIPWLSLAWTVGMVQWSAGLPGASLEISQYSYGMLWLTYLALAVLYWRQDIQSLVRRWWGRLTISLPASIHGAALQEKISKSIFNPGTLTALSIGVVLIWLIALSQPDGYLHVYFLDIGQGDGILIQTPSGRQVLIDGGKSPQLLLSELGAVMPFWDRSLDLMVMTHPDIDHMGAQPDIVARYHVGMALESGNFKDHEDGKRWREQMEQHDIPVEDQQQGGWIDLGDGASLWVLWPPYEDNLDHAKIEEDDKNERSLVLKLVYGEFSVLLTGDAGLLSESELLQSGAPVASQILKVGHHGSNSSTSSSFVQRVAPVAAVIQVGENRYGHPTQEVLDTLSGRMLLRNDVHGRVHLWSDGSQMWIDTEQGDPVQERMDQLSAAAH
jgi:competence protein ComEC